MTKHLIDRINRAVAHPTEPAYYIRTSTPKQRKQCKEGLPQADCEFFHDCLR